MFVCENKPDMKLGALSEYKIQPTPHKGITLFTNALAVVSVVVSFTGIKCGKPVNDSAAAKMAVLPLAVVLVKILWSISNL